MKHFYSVNKSYFLAGIFIWVMATGCGRHDDEEIKEDITEQLKENAAYSGVNATVKDGVVTLAGSCDGDDCATQLENKIKEVEGVKSIQNNLQNNNATDLTLRSSVQSIISKYQGVQADVAGGMVVLRGTINRDQVQPLMNELENLQPKKIDNQLAIQ